MKETEEMTVEQLQQLITKKKTEALHKKIQQFKIDLEEALKQYVGKCFIDTNGWHIRYGKCRMARFDRLEIKDGKYGVPCAHLYYTSVYLPIFPKFLESYRLQSITAKKIHQAYQKTLEGKRGNLMHPRGHEVKKRKSVDIQWESSSTEMWYNETLAVNIVSDSDFNVSNFNIEHHLLVDQAIYRTDLANLKPIDAMVFEEALAFLDEFETLLVDASVRFVTKLADNETGRETKTFFSRLVEAAIENKTPQDAETKAVKTDAKK